MDSKQKALVLLAKYSADAALCMDVLSSYQTQIDLGQVTASLSDLINSDAEYINQAFNGLPEAVACSLLLYDEYPDRYAQLMEGIAPSFDVSFLDTYLGLLQLNFLAQSLSDDHNFVFDPRSLTIRTVNSDQPRLKGLTSAGFLEIVNALRSSDTIDFQSKLMTEFINNNPKPDGGPARQKQ